MVIAINLNADIIGKSRRPNMNMGNMGFDPASLVDKKEDHKFPGMESLARRIFRHDYDGPSIFGVMTASLNIMQDRITRSRLAGDPPDVHIAPRLGHLGLMEFDSADESIAEGTAAAMRKELELADALNVLAHTAQVGENEPI